MTARREREDKKGGGGLVFSIRDNIKFQTIMMAGLFKQYIMGIVIVEKICIVELAIIVLQRILMSQNKYQR